MKINSEKIRYLMVGIINSIAGYFIGVLTYKVLFLSIGIIGVGVVANIFSITFSFFLYKLIVFKTKGNWFYEYFKSYIVYGFMGVVGIFLLWVFVKELKISIWFSQGLVMLLTFALSYFGHQKFTFMVKIKND